MRFQQIMDKKADYLLSLKGNQGTLHQDVKLFFESTNTCPPIGHTRYDDGHWRIETRRVRHLRHSVANGKPCPLSISSPALLLS